MSTPLPALDLLPVFNAQPGATLLLSPDWVILGASDDYLAATLTQRATIVGQFIFDAFPDNPETPEANAVANVRASLLQVLATKVPHEMAPQHYDVPDPAHPGQFVERHWQPRHTPVLDAQGQVQFIIQSVQDITASRLAERMLRESRADEQVARAEAELQRRHLYHVLEQAPAMICIFDGPQHTFEFVNPPYQALVGARPIVGKPIAEAMPELAGQPIFGLLDQVYQTGETFRANEMMVQLDYRNEGRHELEKRYYNFIYQARHNLGGAVDGILVFAYDVTAQVHARQQVERAHEEVQNLNEELAAINEELQASNEEYLLSNTALQEAQQQLAQLNQELEARVQERTQQVETQRIRLEQLVMEAPAAIALLNGPELVVEVLNAEYEALFPGRALRGKPILEALPELVDGPGAALLRQVYETGVTFKGSEIPMHVARPSDGRLEERYFDFIYQAQYDVAGTVNGLIVFVFDVTVRVQSRRQTDVLQAELLHVAQHQVQERETLYQVFAQTPAAICIQRGPAHRYDYANQAYLDFFPGRTIVGQTVAEALPETVESGVVDLLDHVYRTGKTYYGTELPLLIAQPDGSLRQMYFTFTYQAYREHGKIVGISTFAYNVAEQVLARQDRELQRQRLEKTFSQAPVAICVFRGPAYVLELVNPSMGAMLGHAPADLVGQPFFEALPELVDQGLRELLDGVRLTGLPFVAHEREVYLNHRPDKLGFFNFTYEPQRDEQGQVVAITCVATDVTEQVRARRQVQDLNEELAAINEELQATNEELNDSNTQLTRTNTDLDNFVYTASHDLKQPIANLEGLLLALQHELPVAGQVGEVPTLLHLMQNAIERFGRTIGHLTEVSRLQKEHQRPATYVSLARVVQEVQLDLAPLITQVAAQLRVDVPGSATLLFAEKNLRSVVYNLLSNALKYRHPDRAPQIQVTYRAVDAYQVLEVQDNGLGLDLSRGHEKLFAMFQRLHSHVEGTGIGLYMIKKMVENVNGHIEVESELNQGTSFRIYFPR